MPNPTRVGLIGAGYIATWHAEALRDTAGVTVAAVADTSRPAAEALAAGFGAQAFGSVEELIESGSCDAVHILTPPHLHKDIAIQCLTAGLHVTVEKPVATSAEDTRAMAEAADASGARFHAGHNFLGLPSYTRLKKAVDEGTLGRVSSAELTWALPLAPLRSGPYNLWLLREPRNLLLELGPHLMAFAIDLFGPVTVEHTILSKPVDLPGEDTRPQMVRILAKAGDVDLSITVSMVESVDDRSVTLRGSSGRARLDFAADTLIVDRENTSDLIVNPLRRQLDMSGQHLFEGMRNAFVQTKSLNKRSAYGQSFRGMNRAIYDTLDKPADPRFGAEAAVQVMQALDDALALVPEKQLAVAAPAVKTRDPKPTAMVIGGTGFIGRALTRALVAQGRDVRVLSRGKTGPFPDLPDQVETVGVSLRDREGLTNAMRGMDVVFNLARAMGTSWDDCLINDVGVAETIAESALTAEVGRLVYTGTIASYDMADPQTNITEDLGFPEDMTDRNLYARSKAECERRLMAMHQERGLPLTIARPGIVIGPGGPLQHWGIGRWHGAGAVRIWGHGNNILPFVLNDDVADGLIRMGDDDAALGEDFNLVGEPMLTGRDYFDAIHKAYGAKLRVSGSNLNLLFAADAVKHVLKKHALRRMGLTRPSLVDWKSRAHFSPFVNDKPKNMLGWAPEADKGAFIEKGIKQANLFGF